MLDVAERMISILSELHARGFAHGDPHSGNWLLGDPEDLSTLKLIDFGLAAPLSSTGDHRPLGVRTDLEEIQQWIQAATKRSLPHYEWKTSQRLNPLDSLSQAPDPRNVVG